MHFGYNDKITAKTLEGRTNLKKLTSRSCDFNSNTFNSLKNLEYLNINGNYKINGISGLDNLKVLHVCCEGSRFPMGPCLYTSFNKSSGSFMELEELYADRNSSITNISRLKKLKILSASNCTEHNCGIGDERISNALNLLYLNASGNSKITNVSKFKNLRILIASNKKSRQNSYLITHNYITHVAVCGITSNNLNCP